MTNLPVWGKFSITAVYGQIGTYWKSGHKGIDFVSDNKDVYSTCDGTVRVVAYDENGWGRYVSIGDENGWRHIFCHMAEGSVKVAPGQRVMRSTVIGKMGATGNVTGVHLHYQLNDAGNNAVNPCEYLGIPNKAGVYYSDSFIKTEDNNMDGFKDDSSISSWARDAVDKVVAAGIMQGDEQGNFKPHGNLTRQEAAVIIERLLKRWG